MPRVCHGPPMPSILLYCGFDGRELSQCHGILHDGRILGALIPHAAPLHHHPCRNARSKSTHKLQPERQHEGAVRDFQGRRGSRFNRRDNTRIAGPIVEWHSEGLECIEEEGHVKYGPRGRGQGKCLSIEEESRTGRAVQRSPALNMKHRCIRNPLAVPDSKSCKQWIQSSVVGRKQGEARAFAGKDANKLLGQRRLHAKQNK